MEKSFASYSITLTYSDAFKKFKEEQEVQTVTDMYTKQNVNDSILFKGVQEELKYGKISSLGTDITSY